jgi:hypothetical protein
MVRTDTRTTDPSSLRVPETLRALLGSRLARLPTETGDVLLEIAALARPTVEVLAEAHGDREGVLRALDVAMSEGLVRLEDSRIRFAHPLHASICYQQAPVWKRRAVHRALAEAVSDREERALHLARAADAPDANIATALDAAAMSAYDDVADSTGTLVGVAEEHSKRVNSALRGIVARHCELRHFLVVGSAAKADREP